ncbi:MAG: hypothetical protein A4E53_01038 [Pelotomaculum sp. PtaB.Bin104]|nr:MAG: hypothetical protein A4E53_01038 [Pelotomaculum sp. PtaB.Bin104]
MGKKLTVSMARKEFFNNLVSEWSLYEAIKRKRLPAVHIGRRVLLDEDSLRIWWERQQEDSVKQTESIGYGKIRRIQ